MGIIGIGSMGANIAQRLHDKGYSLVLYNKTPDAYSPFQGKEGITFATDISDFTRKLKSDGKKATVWMMVPGGSVTNSVVLELSNLLTKGDIVIDASNSDYTDSIANHKTLAEKKIFYLDVGCAGGPSDLLKGVALYVGGDAIAYKRAKKVFKIVSGKGAYGYVGGPGAGQLVKFFHNEMFYVQFPVAAEAMAGMMAVKSANPAMGLDLNEAARLMSKSPPITTGIMDAISEALAKGIPNEAPQMTISTMVKAGAKRATDQGANLSLMNAVLDKYDSLPEATRRIYAAAKKILTGH
jgi:6-phosphogluconate dehydrogenase